MQACINVGRNSSYSLVLLQGPGAPSSVVVGAPFNAPCAPKRRESEQNLFNHLALFID